MKKIDALWNAVDEKVEAIRRAKETTENAHLAAMVLANQHVEGYFKQRFKDILELMLDSTLCPDDELPRWRANAAAVLDHYTRLTAAVTAGEVANKRLTELDSKEG